MPTSRAEMAGGAIGTSIFVPGGLDSRGFALPTFQALDVASGAWRTLADLPIGLHHAAVAAFGDHVYVTGGYTGRDFTPNVAAAWRYATQTDVWERIADMPAPRAAHAMAELGGKLYVVGGVGPRASELWIFDPSSDSWDVLATDLPTPREHLGAVALDGKIFAVGGRAGSAANLATVEAFDPASGGWERHPDMPTARSGLGAASIAGSLFVAGGEAFDPAQTFPEVERYDPATRTWTVLPDLPTPRHGVASVAVDRTWYLVGGGVNAGLSVSNVVEVLEVPSGE